MLRTLCTAHPTRVQSESVCVCMCMPRSVLLPTRSDVYFPAHQPFKGTEPLCGKHIPKRMKEVNLSVKKNKFKCDDSLCVQHAK